MNQRTAELPAAWELQGSLAFKQVPDRYRDSLAWYRESGLPETVELGNLEHTDSSALALLLEWQSWARREDRRLNFVNPPEGLRVFAELTGTAELLGWPEGGGA